MAESKNVAAYRKTRQEGDPAAAAEAEGKAAKRGLEVQDAESRRPGAGKSPAPGDNAKPGTVQADVADDPRRNRPTTR
jgi:hypothetical protein